MFGAISQSDFCLFVRFIHKVCESTQEAACLALMSYAARFIAPMNSISLRTMAFFLLWIDIMQAGRCQQFLSKESEAL